MDLMINEKKVDISWSELFELSSGVDQLGMTVCAASLYKETPNNKEDEDIVFGDSVANIHHNGGAVTVTIDLTSGFYANGKRALEMIEQSRKKHDEALALILTPYFFKGEIIVLLQGLAYAELFHLGPKGKKLVLTFNHELTQVMTIDGSQFDKYVSEAKAEMRRLDEALEMEIREAEAEKQAALEEMNPLSIQLREIREAAEADLLKEESEDNHV